VNDFALTIMMGIQLALLHALPVVVFAVIYLYGRRLDLSIDAQVAVAGVIFGAVLAAGGGWVIAALAGIATAIGVAMILFLFTYYGRVQSEVASLLIGFVASKLLELLSADSYPISAVGERLQPWLLRTHAVPDWMLGVGVALIAAVILHMLMTRHTGLMYRAVSENPSLRVSWSRGTVLGLVTIILAALTGLAGVIQADRQGVVFTGFQLGIVVEGFVAAELTSAIRRRLLDRAQRASERARPWLLWLVERGLVPQVLAVAILLGTLSYALIRFLHPAVPSIVQGVVVLVILVRGDVLRDVWWRMSANRGSARAGEDFTEPRLVLDGISKSFRTSARAIEVLREVSFAFSRTGCFVLYGDNGSGKSTMLRIISGAITPDRGAARFGGVDASRFVRMLAQDPLNSLAPSLSVSANLHLAGRRAGGKRQTDDELRGTVARFTASSALLNAWNRPVATLSGGQIQLLAVICSAISEDESPIVLADEPTKTLDRYHCEVVETQLVTLAKTRLVIITSHTPRLDLAPPAHQIRIHNGVLEVATQHVSAATVGQLR
jgi:ABC-type multidrug transport system ATPase subunit